MSFFFISVFWKPYYLFSQGFHKSVWEYWRGMVPYYVLFALFTAIAAWLKTSVIESRVDSFWTLAAYGAATYIPLLAAFFVLLFHFTKGMKYFVARKPVLFSLLSRVPGGKKEY